MGRSSVVAGGPTSKVVGSVTRDGGVADDGVGSTSSISVGVGSTSSIGMWVGSTSSIGVGEESVTAIMMGGNPVSVTIGTGSIAIAMDAGGGSVGAGVGGVEIRGVEGVEIRGVEGGVNVDVDEVSAGVNVGGGSMDAGGVDIGGPGAMAVRTPRAGVVFVEIEGMAMIEVMLGGGPTTLCLVTDRHCNSSEPVGHEKECDNK